MTKNRYRCKKVKQMQQTDSDTSRLPTGPDKSGNWAWVLKKVKVKVNIVNLYSASLRVHTSNGAFVTDQSRRPPSHRVQLADTGWRGGQARQPQSAVPRSPPSVTHI